MISDALYGILVYLESGAVWCNLNKSQLSMIPRELMSNGAINDAGCEAMREYEAKQA